MLQLYLSMIEDPEDRFLLEQIYHKYHAQMFKLAFSILKNTQDAEDALQDVFIKIAKKHIAYIKTLKHPTDVRNYLLEATKNTCVDLLKKRNRERVLYETDENILCNLSDIPDEDFVKSICTESDYNELVFAIESLDPCYRDVLYFHFVLELSVGETAKHLGIKKSTAKTRLVRGKKILLSMLGEGDKTKNGNN